MINDESGATEILALIGKTDAFNAVRKNQTYAAGYITVFKTLNKIWKMNSSRSGRETFLHYLKGYKIEKPHRIRWNQIFDAVSFANFFTFFIGLLPNFNVIISN